MPYINIAELKKDFEDPQRTISDADLTLKVLIALAERLEGIEKSLDNIDMTLQSK